MDINEEMNTTNSNRAAEEWVSSHAASINPRYRLGYHLMPTVGWMNDPNGLVYFQGQYHAFYQHHPYSAEWGPMHWGHAVSDDMVHWRRLPIALVPGGTGDRDGCYSGSAVDDDGVLSLIYTGQVFHSGDIQPFNVDFTETQNLATSTDGIHFDKSSRNPVIAHAPKDNSRNFRDPKVWRHGGWWYGIIGSSTVDDDARALLYRSHDLREWEYRGAIAHSEGRVGQMWECPDFFEVDGSHVLLFSPVGMQAQGNRYRNVFQTGYLLGDFDYESSTLTHGTFEELDRGHDFYASQTLEAPDGRRICMGWMNMWQTPMPEQQDGWAGALTLPRELHVVDGTVRMTPIAELQSLRSGTVTECSAVVRDREILASLEANRCEILVSCEGITRSEMTGLSFDIGLDSPVTFTYDRSRGLLSLDRGGEDGVRAYECGTLDHLDLHAYLDNSSLEIFVNDGLATFTSRIYPAAPATLMMRTGDEGVRAKAVVYSLESIG
jgi:beta-fructofuranosidase